MPTLDRITVYPVKSLDGVEVAAANVLPTGALEHDRRWHIVDPEGGVVSAKRAPLVHAIRAEFTIAGLAASGAGAGLPPLGPNVVALAVDPAAVAARAVPGVERLARLGAGVFPLVPGSDGPCGWLSEALGIGVLLVEHHTEFVFGHCDRVSTLNLGRLLRHGTPQEVRTDPEVIRVYLGA